MSFCYGSVPSSQQSIWVLISEFMKARGYRCIFLVILIYWVFLFQSPCWWLFGCGLCSVFPIVVPPTVLALNWGGEAKERLLCQNPRTPEIPVLALPSHVFWGGKQVLLLKTKLSGNTQSSNSWSFMRGLCWGLCILTPKSALELPGASSSAKWWDPASWDQFLWCQGGNWWLLHHLWIKGMQDAKEWEQAGWVWPSGFCSCLTVMPADFLG